MRRDSLLAGMCAVACLALLTAFGCSAPRTPEGRGERVFKRRCSGCHNLTDPERMIGPSLKGLFQETPSGKVVNIEEHVREQVRKGSSRMPSFGDAISDEELKDLIAYLKTL